jgi:hypothetical protein
VLLDIPTVSNVLEISGDLFLGVDVHSVDGGQMRWFNFRLISGVLRKFGDLEFLKPAPSKDVAALLGPAKVSSLGF